MISDTLSDAAAEIREQMDFYDAETQVQIWVVLAVMDWLRAYLDAKPSVESRGVVDRPGEESLAPGAARMERSPGSLREEAARRRGVAEGPSD